MIETAGCSLSNSTNAVFENTMENWENVENSLSEPIFHYYIVFHRKFVSKKFEKMRESQIVTNKSVYIGLSELDLSKTVMYEFW